MTPTGTPGVGGVGPLAPAAPTESRRAKPRRYPSGIALRYTNGVDVVEISHAALHRFVDAYGTIPLPMSVDPMTGDRRVFDAKSGVRAVYDGEGNLREVSSRGPDASFVRILFPRAL